VVNTLKVMKNFEPITTPDQEDTPVTKDMDTNDQQFGAAPPHIANNTWQAAHGRQAKATPIRPKIPQGRGS
jgi:hypothetical protein